MVTSISRSRCSRRVDVRPMMSGWPKEVFFEIRQVQTASSGATRHGHFSQTFQQVGQRARASGGVVGCVFTGIVLPTTDGADDVY